MSKKEQSTDKSELERLFQEVGHPMRLDDVLRYGNIARAQKKQILTLLDQLTLDGTLIREKSGLWSLAANLKTVSGILQVQRGGAAFVLPGKQFRNQPDIYIPSDYLADALNGDTVEVRILPGRRGRSPEGRVARVLERANREITVRVRSEPRATKSELSEVLAVPADARLLLEVLVDVSGLERKPRHDELLVVRLDKPTSLGRQLPLWTAVALRSLGREDEISVQENLTKLNHEIPQSFPDSVLNEAAQAAEQPFLGHAGRRDLTGLDLLTIDGPDARDFDDAIFVRRHERGWNLVVAIADVSAFVRPGKYLDREARDRGNSYYFPASVEPMLPEVLSNGVCSLRPDEERMALVVDLQFGKNGQVGESTFYPAKISSKARLTYEFVQDVLDGKAEPGALDVNLAAMLHEAAELAAILRLNRSKRGSLNFDLPEAEMEIVDGRVVSYHNRQVLFSHQIIEALMVAANEAVAVFLRDKGIPCLYRVHPAPDLDKLKSLAKSLASLGVSVRLPKQVKDASWLPPLLAEARGGDQEDLINTLVLRSMMQARYDPEPEPHFGLASDCYCHFTSPIRRYADLVNHRALRHALGLDPGGPIPSGHKLLAVAQTCNDQERVAQTAEREINRRMGCLYLQDKVGRSYRGVISGVMQFGVFVQLENLPVEGMIRLEALGRDFYEYDYERQELFGRKSGQVFRIGQSVQVVVQSVSIGRLEIDLALAGAPSARRQVEGRRRETGGKRNSAPAGRSAKKPPKGSAKRPAKGR